MKSGEAFGWLIAGLINDHILVEYDPADPDAGTTYIPDTCGPCAAWRDWFSVNRGLTDSYTRHLPDRNWAWMKADGGVDWDYITEVIKEDK